MSDDLSIWEGAAQRGIVGRRERQQIIKGMTDGMDYGLIPNTKKPTLLKPGAEYIFLCLNLYPSYEELAMTLELAKGFIMNRYRCVAIIKGTDTIVSTGIGSCNSYEKRYRWTSPQIVCPECGQEKIIRGKAQYGGGFVCWQKKGGCGAKFQSDNQSILQQDMDPIQNPDIIGHANTIDKMSQKRAIVACALHLGFSVNFTQDLEDYAPVGLDDGMHDEAVKVEDWKKKEADALANPGEPKVLGQPAPIPQTAPEGNKFALCHMGHAGMKGQPFVEQPEADQMWYLTKLHEGAVQPDNKYRKANAKRLEYLVNLAMSHGDTINLAPPVTKKLGDIAADKAVAEAL